MVHDRAGKRTVGRVGVEIVVAVASERAGDVRRKAGAIRRNMRADGPNAWEDLALTQRERQHRQNVVVSVLDDVVAGSI